MSVDLIARGLAKKATNNAVDAAISAVSILSYMIHHIY